MNLFGNRSQVQWFRVHRNLNRPTSKANEKQGTLNPASAGNAEHLNAYKEGEKC